MLCCVHLHLSQTGRWEAVMLSHCLHHGTSRAYGLTPHLNHFLSSYQNESISEAKKQQPQNNRKRVGGSEKCMRAIILEQNHWMAEVGRILKAYPVPTLLPTRLGCSGSYSGSPRATAHHTSPCFKPTVQQQVRMGCIIYPRKKINQFTGDSVLMSVVPPAP